MPRAAKGSVWLCSPAFTPILHKPRGIAECGDGDLRWGPAPSPLRASDKECQAKGTWEGEALLELLCEVLTSAPPSLPPGRGGEGWLRPSSGPHRTAGFRVSGSEVHSPQPSQGQVWPPVLIGPGGHRGGNRGSAQPGVPIRWAHTAAGTQASVPWPICIHRKQTHLAPGCSTGIPSPRTQAEQPS